MKSKQLGWIRRFIHWLFGAPFQELPSEFGDPVPPELRAFQAQAEETQHRPQGRVVPSSKQAKPPRQEEVTSFWPPFSQMDLEDHG